MYRPLKYKPDLVCDNCGKFGVFDLGDKHLCNDCYMEFGSCCMEFGENDLWKKDDSEKSKEKNSTDKSKRE